MIRTRILAIAIALGLAACGSNTNVNADLGLVRSCTPGAKECVSDSLARVCPPDGMGWLGVPCATGTKCSMGACVADNSVCKPNTGSCVGPTAMRCMDNGMGYATTTCPTGTACVAGGVCKGTCVLGSSTCSDLNTVATCANGNSTTPTGCPSGHLCVDTTTDPAFPTAACKPAACTPVTGDCNTVCGNKNDASANQAQYTSTCVSTPNGYAWQANKCLAPKTCSPTGVTCAGGAYAAACSSQCNPGDVRCNGIGNGTQTCRTDSTWGPATPCDPTTGQACVANVAPGQAVCGDPVCNFGPGTCDGSGLFHACVGGKVSTTGVACTTGICAATVNQNTRYNGLAPGKCFSECVDGDRKCVPGTSNYWTCASGVWGVPSGNCSGEAGANNCFNTTNASGRPDIVCGVCQPNSHQCGTGDAGVNGAIQLCDATGQWGPTSDCTVGACQRFYNRFLQGFDAACTASCVPGEVVCENYWFYQQGTNFAWNTNVATCGANGTPGPGTPCSSGQGCRRDTGGKALGCVQCVGSTTNEFGLIDTACADATGAPGGNVTLLTCRADNTWGPPQACAAGVTCQRATGNSYNSVKLTPMPMGPYCHRCYTGVTTTVCTESNMLAGYGRTCAAGGRGVPTSCPSIVPGATVNDCCAGSCFADDPPRSAYCGPFVPSGGSGCGCGCGSGL